MLALLLALSLGCLAAAARPSLQRGSILPADAPLPTLPNVTLGAIETVIDWATSHCTCAQSPGCTDPHDPDYTDTPPRAYVSLDGYAHLWSTDAESRQATRAAVAPNAPFFHNCSVHAPSQFNCLTSAYNFQTWLHSPYMMPDGVNAFALTRALEERGQDPHRGALYLSCLARFRRTLPPSPLCPLLRYGVPWLAGALNCAPPTPPRAARTPPALRAHNAPHPTPQRTTACAQCAGNSSCTHSNGGDCANEAIQLFVSSNGGWDWVASDNSGGPPGNLVVVSPYTYEYSRDTFNASELGFGDPTSVVYDAASATYNVLISASNPPIGDNGWHGVQERGQCLLRSATPMQARSWRAWDGQAFAATFVDPYTTPVTNYSAHACKPVNTSMLHVNLGWSTHFGRWISSGFGSYRYANGTDIPCCGAFLYSTSADLLNWDTPQLIRPNQQEGSSATWEYDAAFLDETAWTAGGKRNWHESIGADTAHLYFWQADAPPGGRSVKRQTVSFV